MTLVRVLCLSLAVVWPALASAQGITAVSSPSANTNIKAANDFATRAFQDPWDMSQRTDVGPFLGSNDAGSSNWAAGFTFSGGVFTGTTTTGDAQLWLLDTGNPLAAPIGKTGTNYPIDASTYKLFAVRMSRPSGASPTQAQVLTWPRTIYDSSPTAHFSGSLPAGTGVYFIHLGANAGWTGTQRALRFQPTSQTGETVSVDWARLVSTSDATTCQPIRWTGGSGLDGAADVYLDTDNNFANGFYGIVQGFATSASTGVSTSASRGSASCPVVSGAFNFAIGALPAGTYYAFVAPLNTTPTASNVKYSPGAWTVGDIPTMKITSPSDEGSGDDFASSQLGDPWDMDKLTDIDSMVNVNNPQITTIAGEAADGTSLPNQRVFMASNAPGVSVCPDMSSPGDPQLTLLSNNKRGKNFPIDASRYRLLTVEFGIPNAARDVLCGSVARVIWRQKGDLGGGSVSDDIIFNQRAGVNLLDKVTLDLATTIIEQGTGAGGTNWTNGAGGGIDIFRFDPHEFTPPTNFYVKRIKLADFERAKTTYTITWTYSKSVGSVDLYYDLDNTGFDGTQINAVGSPIDATLGTYTWTIPSNLPTTNPTRPVYIYAVFSDVAGSATCPGGSATCNANQVYSPLPVVLDSDFAPRPRLVLSRQTLNFGAQGNTSTVTDPQTVRLTFVGAGTAPCWTISTSDLNFTVSPSSGTGNQTVTVSVVPQTFAGGGSGLATFTVNNGTCGNTMLNPGQQFVANFNIAASPQAPTGAVDTPADNATVVGSMGITGWVIDDIGVTFVKIYRQAVAGEAGDGLGRVLIGDANLVEGARPDIEAANPTKPFNYRGGWGYLVLTNFLPNQGNGTFVFQAYAYDKDGHEAFLGQRTVIAANTTATEPFGAIDTPGQGATVSGSSVANFGWVLTKGPNRADPPAGGAVSVVWDGAIIGSPGQWTSRADLTSLFPAATYPGIVNALGVYVMNTTLYTDGVHTLSWLVVANNGQPAGIGSRYVTTVNGNSLTLTDSAANGDLGRKAQQVASLEPGTPVRASSGYGIRQASRLVTPDPTGLRTVYGRTLDRVVVDASRPGAKRYEAYQVVDGTLRALPIGASFDDRRGVLYWQPGLGFSGSYDFVLVRDGSARVPVRVVLTPDTGRPDGSRLTRGLFPITD